jgi:hypothetical protein
MDIYCTVLARNHFLSELRRVQSVEYDRDAADFAASKITPRVMVAGRALENPCVLRVQSDRLLQLRPQIQADGSLGAIVVVGEYRYTSISCFAIDRACAFALDRAWSVGATIPMSQLATNGTSSTQATRYYHYASLKFHLTSTLLPLPCSICNVPHRWHHPSFLLP